MEKKNIETFIKKYNLGGTIDSVIWSNVGDDLSVTAMTSDKKLFASVQLEKAAKGFIDGVEVGILTTERWKKMLAVLSDNISLSLDVDENDPKRVRQIFAEDGKISMKYVASEPSAIDGVPSMKNIPPFDVEILLTPEFVESFNDSFSALGDDETLFTIVMSKRKKKLDVVFGYKEKGSSDSIALEDKVTTTPGKDTIKNPISFTAKNLKEILSANSEVEDGILKVSEAGLASIYFKKDGWTSQYYMVKVEVED